MNATHKIKFAEIPQMTSNPAYSINVDWTMLDFQLTHWAKIAIGRGDKSIGGLDMDPDFQRAHVWTEQQQTAYVEFILRGGSSSRQILWNAVGWMHNFEGKVTLVDGKQRLNAVLRFLHNELPAFGQLYKEYDDHIDRLHCDFIFMVNDLPTRAAVLKWYLELNSGGTPHTEEELNRVKALYAVELSGGRLTIVE